MDRRTFIGKAGLATGAAAASTLATPALAQDVRELKMVTTWPRNFPGLGTGAQRAADRITALSDGRLKVELFAAGELVPPFESFDAVSSGTADIYHGAEYYWIGKHKAFNFFAAMPMGMTAPELDAWINHGGGQELWDELSAQFNVKGLMAGNTGVQMGGWFREEINSLEDLKGLKFRMPGIGGDVLRELGVNVQSLPGGEIFPALQAGTIDGTEWVGPWNDLAFGFYQVAKFYYYPGYHEPGTGLAMGINLDVWNSLSDADRAIIAAVANAENNIVYSEFTAKNGDALQTLINEHDVQLRRFPDEVFAEFGRLSGDVTASAAEGDIGQRIHESFLKSKDATSDWMRISEQTYTAARDKVEQG